MLSECLIGNAAIETDTNSVKIYNLKNNPNILLSTIYSEKKELKDCSLMKLKT